MDIPAPVIELNDVDFDDQLNVKRSDFKDKAVVLFFSPSCGHCHKMMPAFIDAAMKMDPQLKFGVVNIAKNPMIMERQRGPYALFNIPGVPKMVSYNNGDYFSTYSMRPGMTADQARKYRTLEDILQYINGIGTAEVHDE